MGDCFHLVSDFVILYERPDLSSYHGFGNFMSFILMPYSLDLIVVEFLILGDVQWATPLLYGRLVSLGERLCNFV
jgi:hypothetical protein